MSHQATSWVLERSEAEGYDFVVLFVIANHCHPDGTGAWPSYKTIAAQSRASERGVRYAIERLEGMGELVVERHRASAALEGWKGYNEYRIPGVVRDGFFRMRIPRTDKEEVRHSVPKPEARGEAPTEARGEAPLLATEVKELNTEQLPEQSNEVPLMFPKPTSPKKARASKIYSRPQTARVYEQAPRESAQERRAREASEQVTRVAATIQAYRDRRAGK